MQQASEELHKLITALSPTIYRLQIATRKFRLTTAENYHQRVRLRSLDIYMRIYYNVMRLMLPGTVINDGLYINLNHHQSTGDMICMLFRANALCKYKCIHKH